MKARDRDPASSLEVCRALGAEAAGLLIQRDTYFEVPHGRLKLREEAGVVPHLIRYERPDTPDRRESCYRIVEVSDAGELIAALSEAIGVWMVIAKQRRLFVWKQVRIHLDEVEGLGSFIEFEAIAAPGSDLSREIERVRFLRERFGIEDVDLIGPGYADLALSSR